MVPQTPQTHRLTLYNSKGGVGKTTVAINLAGALNQRGYDVGFVDLDPQGNATEGLGYPEAYDADPPTLFDAILDQDPRVAARIVREHPEFDLLPSNVDMLTIEKELIVDEFVDDEPASDYLGVLLDELEDVYEWDYTIIDAPPFFGVLSDNALYASKNVIIPALAESTSERAIELAQDHFNVLEKNENIYIDEIAAVANRVETNNESERMEEFIKTAFPDIPVYSVRKRVALQRAYTAGVSLFEYDKQSDMEEVFLDLADGVVEYFEEDDDDE